MYRSIGIMSWQAVAAVTLCLLSVHLYAAPVSGQGTWETTLQGRLPLTPGGMDYQAYYDTVLNITWLANADLSETNTFGIEGVECFDSYGCYMTWDTSRAWIAAMNTPGYLGVNDWRLPTVTDTGNPGCDFAYSGTDCGWNVDPTTGEMAHLMDSTLGNIAEYDTNGNLRECARDEPSCLLNNTGPFSNVYGDNYWTGTEWIGPGTFYAWYFSVGINLQREALIFSPMKAWPVRDGDIGVVPIPATAWLLATGIAGLGGRRWLKRKISS